MGLQDRDYMRNRHKVVPLRRQKIWQRWLPIALALIAVLSAIVLLIRGSAELVQDFGPTPGSLIVNINTASSAELQTIPGIGPTRAAQIITSRPYESVNDLVNIVGIGEQSMEGVRPFVTVDGKTRKR